MKLLKEYDAESILSEEVFTEIFNEPDEIQKARMLLSFQERAEQLDKEHKGTLKNSIPCSGHIKRHSKKLNHPRKAIRSNLQIITHTLIILKMDMNYTLDPGLQMMTV